VAQQRFHPSREAAIRDPLLVEDTHTFERFSNAPILILEQLLQVFDAACQRVQRVRPGLLAHAGFLSRSERWSAFLRSAASRAAVLAARRCSRSRFVASAAL
jgi:hypothetical protein